jgi:hypothetical protein
VAPAEFEAEIRTGSGVIVTHSGGARRGPHAG